MTEYGNADTTKVATILAQDVEIEGTVSFKNSLTINGILNGDIVSEGTLVVNPTAKVTATIKTKRLCFLRGSHRGRDRLGPDHPQEGIDPHGQSCYRPDRN